MEEWLRRLRGALGIGLTWAAGWAVVGPLSFLLLVAAMFGVERAGLELLFGSAGFFALSGFVGGATFSMLLSLADGRRTFDELSLPRFGGWGALAGGLTYAGGLMLFGDGWGPFALAMTTIAAVLGSGSATSSLALARKADKRLIDASSIREAAELDDGASEALPGRPPQ